MINTKPTTVDDYIMAAPEAGREKLNEIRAVLKKVAPMASEKLKWGVPVYEEKRILFSFAAYTSHLNFMPTGPALQPFLGELGNYTTGKDTIQFRYDEPLPKEMIERIARFRYKEIKENDAKWKY